MSLPDNNRDFEGSESCHPFTNSAQLNEGPLLSRWIRQAMLSDFGTLSAMRGFSDPPVPTSL
jgi:hypothetical protein